LCGWAAFGWFLSANTSCKDDYIQKSAVFKFMDLLGLLWHKSVSLDTLNMLKEAMPDILALLPA
jgi:hypothetical protein